MNQDFTEDLTENSSNFLNNSSNSMATKRPQVYSNFIQTNIQNQDISNNKKNDQLKNGASIKKSRLAQESFESENNQQNSLIQNDLTLINLLNSFIGVNTFKNENVFLDLFQNDIIFLKLNNKIKNFCFKGIFY
jgi:hypothetical protein